MMENDGECWRMIVAKDVEFIDINSFFMLCLIKSILKNLHATSALLLERWHVDIRIICIFAFKRDGPLKIIVLIVNVIIVDSN